MGSREGLSLHHDAQPFNGCLYHPTICRFLPRIRTSANRFSVALHCLDARRYASSTLSNCTKRWSVGANRPLQTAAHWTAGSNKAVLSACARNSALHPPWQRPPRHVRWQTRAPARRGPPPCPLGWCCCSLAQSQSVPGPVSAGKLVRAMPTAECRSGHTIAIARVAELVSVRMGMHLPQIQSNLAPQKPTNWLSAWRSIMLLVVRSPCTSPPSCSLAMLRPTSTSSASSSAWRDAARGDVSVLGQPQQVLPASMRSCAHVGQLKHNA